ncbi:MAG: ABC transporter substrate-binding protein [Burkholderiales bacterium RIFOXYC12_FULL_65_23]|uniref:Bug family tripartite tricarboxylate transporter substrate binding protein n=1 Tax=Malikia spinosa TaxID=86180 RepID=UPI0008D71C5B|nr:tripartite tricarboxylate transporter substrate binding protein [Malikia spinosa]OGB70975.1 MAG: ABC transporter substrate-binding protein [Burkholderiales bacterium RIFOXYC12_FULL_65_23]
MDHRKRFTLKRTTALIAGMTLAASAMAQAGKPLTLMVPYPAGGVSDVIARIVSPVLAKHLERNVIVENLGGAGGAIAAQRVLNLPADGNIIYQGSPNELILTPMAVAAVKHKSEDFRPVQSITLNEMIVFARKDLPVGNGDELAAYAAKMAKEGRPLTYASVGPGSLYHVLGEQMSKVLNVPMTHVPYKGGAPATQDLMGGLVDIFITPYGKSYVELVNSGKIKAVAALSAERQAAFKSVPTLNESKALKGFTFDTWQTYFVRKDTPEPVVQALYKALSEVANDAGVRTTLEAQGMIVPKPQALDKVTRTYHDEIAQYRAIAKSINLQAQ